MKTIAICVFFILLFPLFGNKRVVLNDVLTPESVTVDKENIYITEKYKVHAYSKKIFKNLFQFGQSGQGPSEFMVIPQMPINIDVNSDNILVNSFGKLSVFSKKGKFIEEKKLESGFYYFLKILGVNYISRGVITDNNVIYSTFNINDSNLKKIKEIYRIADDFQPGKGTLLFNSIFQYDSFGEKIIFTEGTDFLIKILNNKGEQETCFSYDYKKIIIPSKFKKKVISFLKNSPKTKNYFYLMKPIKFPKYFPSIREMRYSNNKVYVITYKQKNNQSELFIFTLKGKLLKKSWISIKKANVVEFNPFTINDNCLYQVNEDIEEEKWYLDIYKIE